MAARVYAQRSAPLFKFTQNSIPQLNLNFYYCGNTRKSDSIYTLEPSSCFISDVISSPLKLKNISSTTSVLNRFVT
ncbi:hypothetical protein HanRHA438_Chr16g0752231 [Helianthus annuus]|uniref:Uncharacterized protein n=1 Tax=Helianthus annuus TaxID=4232 RepID=A0A251VNL4_HELAN|nr:hypothetical protein HanXRQr2_Chr16g0740001 [Helianthus annuus]KAJ0437556.1 hypothetical protein HanHA300_Chr16g0603461 [Helianthus annuus]KAJ0459883.1 hypothetical protein HanHA89_Chr16g0654111 [Helianthus annuus]KAJ0640346.1 hypothetical protein HanLR1_Chr16g0614351 [Helianthus annuus]KAJ0644293.1 hypothetical protein HanOQP8_Chr16g0610371 [Helianthus annuus]